MSDIHRSRSNIPTTLLVDIESCDAYKRQMFTTKQTASFKSWLEGLADATARKRIAARIVRVQSGNFGDVKSVGGKVSELRVDYGPEVTNPQRHGGHVIWLSN